jgi:hypothetical protein
MTRNEVVLSASESDDGESGHLALQGIEEIRGLKEKRVGDSSHAP